MNWRAAAFDGWLLRAPPRPQGRASEVISIHPTGIRNGRVSFRYKSLGAKQFKVGSTDVGGLFSIQAHMRARRACPSALCARVYARKMCEQPSHFIQSEQIKSIKPLRELGFVGGRVSLKPSQRPSQSLPDSLPNDIPSLPSNDPRYFAFASRDHRDPLKFQPAITLRTSAPPRFTGPSSPTILHGCAGPRDSASRTLQKLG
jgi:hypothetical protein